MNIRAADEKDIPAIVNLLKASLGEGLMPKSEAYWRWKHMENPFGLSPVLLAEEAGLIVGVRAFMRWNWTDGKRVYKAVRAVDTATHPKFQGKGIFKQLTMGLVDTCLAEGVDFIFNTPNTQSRPGYIKMGWKDVDHMPVRFQIVNPLRRLLTKPDITLSANDWLRSHQKLLATDWQLPSGIHTRSSSEYFQWRYGTVPVALYSVLHDCDNVIFYRFKRNSWGLELRVTDWLTTGQNIRVLQSKLHQLAAYGGARVITLSGLREHVRGGLVLKQGPQVTVRCLATDLWEELHHFNYWSPVLGDMELF